MEPLCNIKLCTWFMLAACPAKNAAASASKLECTYTAIATLTSVVVRPPYRQPLSSATRRLFACALARFNSHRFADPELRAGRATTEVWFPPAKQGANIVAPMSRPKSDSQIKMVLVRPNPKQKHQHKTEKQTPQQKSQTKRRNRGAPGAGRPAKAKRPKHPRKAGRHLWLPGDCDSGVTGIRVESVFKKRKHPMLSHG